MLALLNPESLLTSGGIFLLATIVFAESGLLVGFFLPGDSLLFIAGFLASPAEQEATGKDVLPNIVVVMAVAAAMAIIGDQVGYLIGKKLGPAVFARPKSRLFDPAHVVRANEFFTKHGSRTIIIARFVPVVRTFVPVVAGVGEMDYKTFIRFNIIGGLAWGAGIPLLGYFLGKIDFVKNNIEVAILAIVLVSLLPVILEFVKHRRAASK
jgi:membrane-associated protein